MNQGCIGLDSSFKVRILSNLRLVSIMVEEFKHGLSLVLGFIFSEVENQRCGFWGFDCVFGFL